MNIGEEAIPPQVQAQATADITPQAMQQKMAGVIGEKEKLDFILRGIAQRVGADFNSRIKNPDTIVKKVAQKRLAGRNYSLDDINDGYGARFIIKTDGEKGKIISFMKKAEELGLFSINKSEPVKTGTYSAYHIDFQTPNGVKGEAQIMTPQQSLESVANHSLRSVHGENPQGQVKALRDKQAEIAKKTPHQEAINKASEIQQAAKQLGNTLDPRLIAGILAK